MQETMRKKRISLMDFVKYKRILGVPIWYIMLWPKRMECRFIHKGHVLNDKNAAFFGEDLRRGLVQLNCSRCLEVIRVPISECPTLHNIIKNAQLME